MLGLLILVYNNAERIKESAKSGTTVFVQQDYKQSYKNELYENVWMWASYIFFYCIRNKYIYCIEMYVYCIEMCVCVCVCVCVYVYIYMYIYTHTYTVQTVHVYSTGPCVH